MLSIGDLCVCAHMRSRLQVERLQFELATVRDELSRRVAAAAESADAMLSNAAGGCWCVHRSISLAPCSMLHVESLLLLWQL